MYPLSHLPEERQWLCDERSGKTRGISLSSNHVIYDAKRKQASKVMIYSFGANNYFSFKDGFDISFALNSKVPKSISLGRKVSTVIGIKGANASGKTNILKAYEFISSFCTRSFSRAEDSLNFVSAFYDSKAPCEFHVDFEAAGSRYIYELSITRNEVLREALYKKVSRKTLIVERQYNEITKRSSDMSALDLLVLKKNASLIDTIKKYKLDLKSQDFEVVHKFFKNCNGNVSSLSVLDDKDFFSYKQVNTYYHNVPDAFTFTKNIIRKCDLGITDIELYERKDDEGKPEYYPIFIHGSKSNPDRWLTYHDESNGTTALYRRLRVYWEILDSGGTLVMDEFDTNLHPDLLPMIIDLFLDVETNPNNAQFIFTAHSLEIINHLGKYRTVLVAKEEGESFCYRLDEIPGDIIRNDRSISALYSDGKIGGVPRL
jgi:AAA15 family ATPase/GTPase